ncbi:MAG: FecR domain-containing protein [Tannerellaceae bacterium]|nr:FecR domain-containing protein [Tannerellaceae bacterium]
MKEEELHIPMQQINNRIDQTASSPNLVVSLWNYRRYIAAVALILIVSGVFYYLSVPSMHTESRMVYVVEMNQSKDSVKTVILPDGSQVWLSNNTTLKYPSGFADESRRVELSGKAFFQVEHDPGRPFTVCTENNVVEVLGTAFSVNTEYAGQITETILLNGTVRIKRQGGDSGVILHPGQQALYDSGTRSLEINEVDAATLTAWRLGIISLHAASVCSIVELLEELYAVRLEINMESLKEKRYNFSFKPTKGIEAAIGQLQLITGKQINILPVE